MPVGRLAGAVCCILRKLNVKSKPNRISGGKDREHLGRRSLSLLELEVRSAYPLETKRREAGNQPPVGNAVWFGYA